MTVDTVALYRTVDPEELALLEASRFRRWPPRLAEQPILYPVTNEEYAVEIASKWNVRREMDSLRCAVRDTQPDSRSWFMFPILGRREVKPKKG
jgi:hypothetical protein